MVMQNFPCARGDGVWWGRGLAPFILKVSGRWGRIVSFTPQALNLRRKGLGNHCVGFRASLNLATANELHFLGHHYDCYCGSV
jgi:hypothetical protein